MKQILIIIFVLASATATFAQPPNNRLDADLKRLNRRFESVESIKRLPVDGNKEVRLKRSIESAERELGRFEKKYPDYDVSEFEKTLVAFKNPQNKSAVSNESRSDSSDISDFAKVENFVETIDEILRFNADASRFIRNDEEILGDTKKQLKDFRNKMQKTLTPDVLALAKDTSNRKIKRIYDKASRDAKSFETELSRVDTKKILEETKQNMMLLKYFRVLFIKEKLQQLNKVFGDDTNIKSANESANKMIGELGTVDDIEQQGEKNYASKVAKARLFPNRQNNQILKNQVISAFKSSPFTQKDFAASKILKVNLVSSGWSVQRNKITGIILSRDQQAHLAVKATNGKCYAYLILLEQKYQGGGKYNRAYMRSGSEQEMLCENASK